MKKLIYTTTALLLMALSICAQNDDDTRYKANSSNPKSTKLFWYGPVYVAGNLGIGSGMSSGFNFDENTVVISENNIKMRFEDTSSPSFPDNDWGFEFNSSISFADGGEDYFKLNDFSTGTTPFCISGSIDHSVYIQGASGNIGFGTNNPLKKLHIYNIYSSHIRLAQVGASGNQSWDIESNETWFSIGDITHNFYYSFNIRTSPPDNAFTLNSNGNVGIGTDNPDHKLEVNGDAHIVGYFYFGDESTDGSWRIGEDGDGLLSFEKRVDGSWVKKMEMK